MGSFDLQPWTRIGAMNLIELCSSARPRSMTALSFDALARVTRWGDWFRPATRVSLGEPQGFPLERFVFPGFLAGHGRADFHRKTKS